MSQSISAVAELEKVARKLRGRIIEMSHHSRVPHLGSALSCVDILAVIYWDILRLDPTLPDDLDRDRFILSKGHAATALFATLALRGFYEESILATLAEDD
ncbi:MAG: transketolase, partial [Desulfobulbaceae bacterium]|nr:transketolase [Desulfobulbaceae bacterium]